MNWQIDLHIIVLILIMAGAGAFGGYLNFLHNFDTTEKEGGKVTRKKYVLLGIGASFLVPAFLQMISSTLTQSSKSTDYLIFAGFCLTASIFSRRFITTIGEKILEAAKKAERVSEENKKAIASTQIEVTSTQQKINDVKLAVDIGNIETVHPQQAEQTNFTAIKEFEYLASSYVERTSIPDYSERLKLKSEIGRKLGEIIIRNKLNRVTLLQGKRDEGLVLGIAYSVQLRPDQQGLELLKEISQSANQLYTKYCILVGFDTLARINLIPKNEVRAVYDIVKRFQHGADAPLLRKIKETINVLSFIDSGIHV